MIDKESRAYFMATHNYGFDIDKRTIKEILATLFDFQEPDDWFDFYDFYEVCKNKIKSKKDKFKSIKLAIDELIEERHVVKRSYNYEDRYRSAWYELFDQIAKGEVAIEKWVEGDLEARIRKGYNVIFGVDIPNRWADMDAFFRMPENVRNHYVEFSDHVHTLVREMGDPENFDLWGRITHGRLSE